MGRERLGWSLGLSLLPAFSNLLSLSHQGKPGSWLHSELISFPGGCCSTEGTKCLSELRSPLIPHFCCTSAHCSTLLGKMSTCQLGRAPCSRKAGAAAAQPYDRDIAGQGRVKHKTNCTNIAIITLAQAPNPFQLQDQPGISLLKQVMEKQGIYVSLAVKLHSFLKQKAIFAFKEVKKKLHGKLAFLF